jgi:hypothetical protein
MAHVISRPHLPHPEPSPADVRLNAYAEPHARLDLLSWGALALSLVSFAIAAAGGSLIGLSIGVIGLIVAMIGQMMSITTNERWVLVPAWVMSALSAALNGFFVWSP